MGSDTAHTYPSTGSAVLLSQRFVHRAAWRALAPRRARLVAATLAIVVLAAGVPATAAGASGDPTPSLRAQIDAIGARYFAAQTQARQLDAELHSLDQRLARARTRAASLHVAARDRAIQLYQGTTQQFTVLFDTTNAMESARRAELIAQAGDHTQAVLDDYANATATLEHQRTQVVRARARQATVVAALDGQRAALDRALARAQAAYRAQLAAEARQRANAAVSRSATRAIPVRNVPKANPLPPTAPIPVAPPPPSHSGTNPHHDDPFLVCTRTRESSGYYGAVNAAGYYGAYQFSQPTWDVTASHAGSPGLIGVRPDRASPWDQDQLAWTLYQWQGNAPWGGLC